MKSLSMKRLLIAFVAVLMLYSVACFVRYYTLPPEVQAQTNTFCAANLTCTVSAPWVYNSSSSIISCTLQNVKYVDAANTCAWTGSDIGGWLNSAYANLPAAGGTIWLSTTTATINYSTPIVFAGSGKFVTLKCVTATSSVCQLNYTPTTATIALTYDVVPSGGTSEAPGEGLSGIQLVNNACATQGGCGSSATGIQFGGTNFGGHALSFNDISIRGFGTGLTVASVQSWGMEFHNWTLANNTTGWSQTINDENIKWDHPRFAGNGTAISITGGGDYYMDSPSIDQSSTVGVTMTGGFLSIFAPHFETQVTPSLTTHFVTTSGTSNIVIQGGGLAIDDQTTSTSDWWFQLGGYSAYIIGLPISTGGRTLTTGVVNPIGNVRGVIELINESAASLTTIMSGAQTGNISNRSFNALNSNTSFSVRQDTAPPHLQVLSQAAGTQGDISLGRTGGEHDLFACPGGAVAFTDCAAGDFAIRTTSTSQKIRLGTGGGNSAVQISNTAATGIQFVANSGTVCTNGELALSAGWQSTGTATVTAVVGTGQTCSWTITTGTTTAANPTVTDTLTNVLPAATTVCELNIHGGTHTAAAGEGFQQTTLSATAPIFTFNGTPTAGGTTYFVTRRCGP